MKRFIELFGEIEFDSRCKRVTAVIGGFAAMLVLTAAVCRFAEPPIALRQLFALIGSLSACGMLNCCAAMTAEAFAKRLPEGTGLIFCIADSAAAALKLFFLLATCGAGLPVACAALIADAVITRVWLLYLKMRAELLT